MWHTTHPIIPADRNGDVAWRFHLLVGEVLHLENYNIIKGSPELSGSMASTLLKNEALQAFLDRHKAVVGGYYHGPDHPCNTDNVVGSLW